MDKQTFKRVLFMHLVKEENMLQHHGMQDVVSIVRQTDEQLEDSTVELVDLREGEFSKTTLSEAVEKLAFEMKNDRSLYSAWRNTMIDVIVNRAYMEDNFVIRDDQRFRQYANSVAEEFLDLFIEDVEANKQRNKERGLE